MVHAVEDNTAIGALHSDNPDLAAALSFCEIPDEKRRWPAFDDSCPKKAVHIDVATVRVSDDVEAVKANKAVFLCLAEVRNRFCSSQASVCARALTVAVFRRGQLAKENNVKHIYMRTNSRNKTELRKYGFTLDASYKSLRGETRDLYEPTYDNMQRVYAEVATVIEACQPEWQSPRRASAASGPSRTTVAIVIDKEEVTHVSCRNFDPKTGEKDECMIFYRWSGALN